MSHIKAKLENLDEQWDIALRIAVEAGTLKECLAHNGIYFEESGDYESAYKLANLKFTSGEISDYFSSRSEMTDVIKKVIDENNAPECSYCAKIRDED